MSILKNDLCSIEIYSIDEAFFLIDITNNRENFVTSLQKRYLDGLESL